MIETSFELFDKFAAKNCLPAAIVLGLLSTLSVVLGIQQFGALRNDGEASMPHVIIGWTASLIMLLVLWWNSVGGPVKHIAVGLMIMDMIRDMYNLIVERSTGMYVVIHGWETILINLGWLVAVIALFMTRRPEASPRRKVAPKIVLE